MAELAGAAAVGRQRCFPQAHYAPGLFQRVPVQLPECFSCSGGWRYIQVIVNLPAMDVPYERMPAGRGPHPFQDVGIQAELKGIVFFRPVAGLILRALL